MIETATLAERRIAIALSGAIAGIAAWAILDLLPDITSSARAILFLATAAGGFFTVLLATLGPLSTVRAALAGLAVGPLAAGLMLWASFRFDSVHAYLESGHPFVVVFLIVALPVPFFVAGLGPARRWTHYPLLFDAAWAIVVRMSAAILFALLFWILLFLSDGLLGLVGIGILGDLIEYGAMPYLLSGAAFGFGIAVAHEMADYVSPHLPLRLLRLLLPVVLFVSAVFLIALPFRGLSGLFGGFSAAGTMLAMAFAAITLISAALDRDDSSGVSGVPRRAVAAMSCMVPIIGGLGAMAVAERVQQYGWTPDRIAAATGAAILTAYGVAYLLAVLLRHDWSGRIRRANTRLALLTLAVGALWLTPILDAQRISAAHQVARFADGSVPADAVDLWSISRDWGVAGQQAIAAFHESDDPAMMARLDALSEASSRADFESAAPPLAMTADLDLIAESILVLPAGAALPEGVFDAVRPADAEIWADACRRSTPAGNPGCAVVVGDFVPREPGAEVITFFRVYDSFTRVRAFFPSRPGAEAGSLAEGKVLGDLEAFSGGDIIDRLAAGSFAIVPKSLNVLRLDSADLIVLP